MKKIGIITFHNSYNCGSMLESYALQHYLEQQNLPVEIINFSNEGQRKLYSIYDENKSLKKIVKNIIIGFHKKQIYLNNEKYQQFQEKYFHLSKFYGKCEDLSDNNYNIIVAGSDQIWNITIIDGDDAYFLPWVKKARKVAYAPSFGAKNVMKYTNDYAKYQQYLSNFDALSIRENNGRKWLKELINKDVDVLIDPTLLLEAKDYDKLVVKDITIPSNYIYFYCPTFDKEICKFVKKVSEKYNLPVMAWSAKGYYVHNIKRFGFRLPEYENPSSYLTLIKNATLIFTTSFHGTIFSTIYRKRFYTIKNGGMYGDDDRVLTLLKSLNMMERLIPYDFDDNYNYLEEVNYNSYSEKVLALQQKAKKYLKDNVEDYYNETIK